MSIPKNRDFFVKQEEDTLKVRMLQKHLKKQISETSLYAHKFYAHKFYVY